MEKVQSGRICVDVPDSQMQVHVINTDHSFQFDRVFRWDASQKDVYDYAAKPIINGVLRGFNGTVFAYGQTASGKTYTMEGPDIEDKVYQGVIPRMVWSIFHGIAAADEHIEFLVKVSIVEIYNERIRCLLEPKKDNLKIHEDVTRGVFIGEMTEYYVGCEQEIFSAMSTGQYNRSIAVTSMNEHSSRSHLIFMLTIEQKNLHDRSVKVGTLHLVDLAGSEKVAKTGASGDRLDEAKNINRSLSALGNVINALTDKKYSHVPYRDSKLTRVLQESLGGNAKTSLIITCSPSYFNEQETISTLRFGQRAKMIKNVVKVNLERSAEELKLILERRDQSVLAMRSRLGELENLLQRRGIALPEDPSSPGPGAASLRRAPDEERRPTQTRDLEDQLQEKRIELKASAERISELNRERDELQRQMLTIEQEKQHLHISLENVGIERDKTEYECNEKAHEAEVLRKEKQALQNEVDDLLKVNHNMLLNAESASLVGTPSGQSASPEHREADDRHRDADRPLKHKVSQLDKNLEQLTVMYHKLVAQNSGLKVEVGENDKKIQRKDQRITQLERNLREAKQKYEKLLTQCANLTAAMDVMGRSKVSGFAPNPSAAVRRPNIVRPVRGGVPTRADGSEDTSFAPEDTSFTATPVLAPPAVFAPAARREDPGPAAALVSASLSSAPLYR